MLTAFFGFAQFQKGNKLLGFGLGLSAGKGESQNSQFTQTTRSNTVNGSVELGFAIKENKLYGFYVGGGYSQSSNETNDPFGTDIKMTNQFYNAGYFTRMYKSLGKGFFVFGDVRGGYSYFDFKNKSASESVQKTHAVSAAFFPGITYKWNNRFLLEVRTGDFIAVGYSRATTTNSSNNEKFVNNNLSVNTSLGLGFLQNFGIGARWIIGQKKSA
ncbi:MAG TPA: hypothetical protein VFV46_08995 [Lacibacter sp.]|nr:hypothetical protein [Lacibacter sp.]